MTVFRRVMIFFDLCIVVVSFVGGYFLAGNISHLSPLKSYLWILPLLLFIWGGLLYHFGMYTSFRIKQIGEILWIVFKTGVGGIFIFGGFTFAFKLTEISRIFLSLVFIITMILISLEKVFLILFFRYIRAKGYNYRNLLIVGTGKRAQHFIDIVNKHSAWGLKILGLIDKDKSKVGTFINGYKIMGTLFDIPEIIHNNVVDEVVFVVPHSWLNEIEEAVLFLEIEGVRTHLAVDHFQLRFARAKAMELHGIPLVTFESTPDKIWHLFIKRIIDIVFSTIGLIVTSPLFLIVAVLIKLTSKGPVLFKQQRCGYNGRKFTLYKFRTMVEDAEQRHSELLRYNEMSGPAFKMTNDPRITKIGKVLRKFSIDELPQLLNVLKGDMSLVGPRPPLPSEVNNYKSWQRRRLSMRPGITCLWQVCGRNKIANFDEWARLDLEYIDNWTLGMDFKILFKTIPVVLLAEGAR